MVAVIGSCDPTAREKASPSSEGGSSRLSRFLSSSGHRTGCRTRCRQRRGRRRSSPPRRRRRRRLWHRESRRRRIRTRTRTRAQGGTGRGSRRIGGFRVGRCGSGGGGGCVGLSGGFLVRRSFDLLEFRIVTGQVELRAVRLHERKHSTLRVSPEIRLQSATRQMKGRAMRALIAPIPTPLTKARRVTPRALRIRVNQHP